MPEQETVSGTIAAIKQWKKGSGFFLSLEGNSQDFYKFGKNPPEVGAAVEMEVKEGTGIFSDKLEVVQIGKGAPGKAKPAEKPKEEPEKPEETFKEGVKVYMDKQNLIVEQTCLKVAGEVVSHLLPRNEKPDWEGIAKTVNFLKRDFVADIIANQEAKK